MTEEQESGQLVVKPQETEFKKTSLSRTLFSLALFIAVDYWLFQSWVSVGVLVTVLFIHELGHFIAMKVFGYKAVNMTFIPFIGAYVSGTATNLSRKNKLIVLLAGPVPGIIIGCIALYLHQRNFEHIYMQAAQIFLLLNVFNLLPVFPLDGGQFFQALYFNGSRIIQMIFLVFSFGSLLYLFVALNYSWGLLLIAALVLMRIGQLNFVNRVRKRLSEEGFDYACSYDDLTDDEYWQMRTVIINESKLLSKKFSIDTPLEDEQPIIRHIESVLVPAYEDDLSLLHKISFTLIWLAAFTVPVLQWLLYKGLI